MEREERWERRDVRRWAEERPPHTKKTKEKAPLESRRRRREKADQAEREGKPQRKRREEETTDVVRRRVERTADRMARGEGLEWRREEVGEEEEEEEEGKEVEEGWGRGSHFTADLQVGQVGEDRNHSLPQVAWTEWEQGRRRTASPSSFFVLCVRVVSASSVSVSESPVSRSASDSDGKRGDRQIGQSSPLCFTFFSAFPIIPVGFPFFSSVPFIFLFFFLSFLSFFSFFPIFLCSLFAAHCFPPIFQSFLVHS